jgi:glycosyltransferase involved in cell wall biosynthesis
MKRRSRDVDSGDELSYVVFEPNFTGHRLNYVALLREDGLRRGATVRLALSSESFDSEEFRMRFPGGLDPHECINLGHLPNIGLRGYTKWVMAALHATLAANPRSRVVVLESDKLLPHVVSRRLSADRRLVLLVMRAPALGILKPREFAKEATKWIAAHVVAKRGATVVCLAPSGPIRQEYSVNGFRATPDPVTVYADAAETVRYRAKHGIGPPIFWYGVFGRITPRKNLGLTAMALAKCAEQQHNLGLLVAGTLSEDELARCAPTLERLVRVGVSVVLDNRLLTDSELDAAISSVDCVVIAHSSNGPSGILGKAYAMGRPIVAAGARSLADDLRRLANAGLYANLNAEDLASSLMQIRSHPSVIYEPRQAAGGAEFARALLW